MTERKGSLMKWKADCGHWMTVYSLAPTPDQCPDCADKQRDSLEDFLTTWARGVSRAVGSAEECYFPDSAAEDLAESGIAAPDEMVQKLQIISDRIHGALGDLEHSERELRALVSALPPKAERLSMPETA